MPIQAPRKIFLIAGEASGDIVGARLMAALRRESVGNIEFRGIGGGFMQAEGLQSLFPMQELSIMGLAEIVPHIPKLLRRIDQTLEDIRNWQPDMVITIDSPGFNKRVAKKLGRGKIRLIHYVAPTVWAWRPSRAKKMARLFDQLLCLFPFEPDYFIREGLDAVFVGHPVMESDLDQGNGAQIRREFNIPSNAPLLCLLPGSRVGEIVRLLPLFLQTVQQLKQQLPDLHIIIPTFPHLFDLINDQVQRLDRNIIVIPDQNRKKDVFAASNAALAASGTISLELTRAKLPFVIAYKISALTAFIARRLVKLKYFTLTNILLDRPAIPEFFQEQASVQNLIDATLPLLQDPAARAKQIGTFEEALRQLAPVGQSPSGAAAMAVNKYWYKP